jgi:hypothetical protein
VTPARQQQPLQLTLLLQRILLSHQQQEPAILLQTQNQGLRGRRSSNRRTIRLTRLVRCCRPPVTVRQGSCHSTQHQCLGRGRSCHRSAGCSSNSSARSVLGWGCILHVLVCDGVIAGGKWVYMGVVVDKVF